jgi:hypothetical protein
MLSITTKVVLSGVITTLNPKQLEKIKSKK